MKRIVITIVIIISVVALIGFVLNNNKKNNEEKTAVVAQTGGAVVVRVDTVKKQPLNVDFVANGNFAPEQELDFAAEKPGRVTRVLTDVGDRVTKGQVLATIRTDQLSVDLQNAEATYQNALKDQQRYENAFQTGGVTQQQLDQAKLTLQNAKAKVQQARINIGDADIRASINGIVNKRYIEPGAVVAAATKLFELVDVSKLKLKATVTEEQVANLKVGDKIKVTASVFPDKKFEGKITFIAPKADNTLNFPIEVEVANNPNNELRAGMYGTANFSFPQQAPGILISRTAFVGSVSSNQVFVLTDTTSQLRNVTAGRIFGDRVEVLNGLKEGEIVITSGQVNLTNGSKVSPVK